MILRGLQICEWRVLYGGVGYGKQNDAPQAGSGCDRGDTGTKLLDHLGRGTAQLNHVKYLVLDEADRMLDMGFLPDVKRIVQKCPRERHSSLFSATVPPQIETLIQWAMHNPETIEIGARRTPAETVKHVIYPVADAQKTDLLLKLLEKSNYGSVIVFCRTKHRADQIASLLKRNRHSVAVLHSNRTQREREEALLGFRNGRYEALVATDIASRGLDIADVSHVVNYDVPQHPEDYIHRIGRTGSAENTGDALTIITASDATHVFAIERFIGKKIPRVKLDNFSPTPTRRCSRTSKPGQKAGGFPGKVRGARVRGGAFLRIRQNGGNRARRLCVANHLSVRELDRGCAHDG